MDRKPLTETEPNHKPSETRKQANRDDWSAQDPRVTYRVIKKIEKVIHFAGGRMSSTRERCFEIARQLEGKVKGNAK